MDAASDISEPIASEEVVVPVPPESDRQLMKIAVTLFSALFLAVAGSLVFLEFALDWRFFRAPPSRVEVGLFAVDTNANLIPNARVIVRVVSRGPDARVECFGSATDLDGYVHFVTDTDIPISHLIDVMILSPNDEYCAETIRAASSRDKYKIEARLVLRPAKRRQAGVVKPLYDGFAAIGCEGCTKFIGTGWTMKFQKKQEHSGMDK